MKKFIPVNELRVGRNILWYNNEIVTISQINTDSENIDGIRGFSIQVVHKDGHKSGGWYDAGDAVYVPDDLDNTSIRINSCLNQI